MNDNHQRVNTGQLFAGLCFVVAVVATVSYFSETPQYTLPSGTPDMRASGELLVRDIRDHGARAAAERFATAVASFGIDDQHAYAHQFGHALYQVEGEDGIAACDSDYGLGCFHQFLGDAIDDMGPDAVARLYEKCGEIVGTRNACQHGLGHGIVAGTGYTEADLATALSTCDSVTQEQSYAGCYGGVFMEYNIRTIASAEQTMGARKPEGEDMYAPCTTRTGESRRICTFWLPQWWFFSVMDGQRDPSKKNELFARMGLLCRTSSHPQACYEGIGYNAPAAFRFDPVSARSACDRVGPDGNGSTYCRAMAGLIFHLTPGESENAPMFCEGLDGRQRAICDEYLKHEGGFSFSLPEPV